ncbi:MAG: hypothetical protein GY934_02590 [Gammaproteobacteria bacterium]|nr:hypothetical protein [Gammaproteobacteria bacterium]
MTLSALVHKGGLTRTATATPATTATHEANKPVTVAPVATVTVAEKPEPPPKLPSEAETSIRAYLLHIDETNPTTITEVINKCRTDNEARAYFIKLADEVPIPTSFDDDDRRHCYECSNFTQSGLCLAARRREIKASRTFYPLDHTPKRCEGYAPGPNDSDRRPGLERWPNLYQKGETHD